MNINSTDTSTTSTTATSTRSDSFSLNRSHIIWGIVYERKDGQWISASPTYPTRLKAREAKSEYRRAGTRAYVIRYSPIVDTRS